MVDNSLYDFRLRGAAEATRDRFSKHEDATDPHPQYLTQGDADQRYALATAGSVGRSVYVQATQPAMVAGEPWVWWQTIGGALSDYHVFDGVLP